MPPRRPKTPPAPMPVSTRRGLVAGAVLLVAVAAWINISHTRQNAADHGADQQTALVVGLIPDVLLALSVMRLRYHRWSVWAWAGVVGSVLLVGWSALSTSAAGLGAKVVALVCLVAAIIATGQAHVPHSEPVWMTLAHADALTEDAARAGALAHETARTQATRIDELVAELATARAAHEAAMESARTATQQAAPTPPVRPGAKRTAGARKPTARGGAQGGDLQRRKSAREAFEASVRFGCALDNAALAALLYGLPEGARPDAGQLRAASARASEWRRALAAAETSEQAQ